MQSSTSPSTSYAAPAVISLGEEYTDEMLPSTSSTPSFDSEVNDDGFYYSSSSDSETDSEDGDDSDYSPISPREAAHHPRRNSIVPSLWHAEHARLLNLQSAVLDNERAAWTREKRLESEVARIKVDLARLQQKQQSSRSTITLTDDNDNHSPLSTMPVRTLASNQVITATLPVPSSSTCTPPARCAGPRGPRPKPQQPRTSSNPIPDSPPAAQTRTNPPALLPKFSFESIKEQVTTAAAAATQPKPAEPEQIAVTVLSHHLTQARSQRAQERQKRRNEHERMRELATLLTLGSEVRKWEERLAWSQYQSTTRAAASDDSHLNTETLAKAAAAANNTNDTDVDPRGKRLSRSSSLPSNRMSYVPPLPSSSSSSQSTSNTKPSPSPALPSLALSPLWRVSAEMILRRRQLSERPRRTPPAPVVVGPATTTVVNAPGSVPPVPVAPLVPALVATTTIPTSPGSTLARPAHTLRGPRDNKRIVSSSSSSSVSGNANANASETTSCSLTLAGTSSGSGSLSAKRNSIPPPISIPPSAPFLVSSGTTTTPAVVAAPAGHLTVPSGSCCTSSPLLSKTTPIKPSALKWAFTAADLAREMEEEERTQQMAAAAVEEEETTSALVASQASPCRTESTCESSEESSGSEDSGKSSSDGSGSSSSSSNGQECPANVERRGRARFSWRKSLPKDGSAGTPASASIPPPPPPPPLIASVALET